MCDCQRRRSAPPPSPSVVDARQSDPPMLAGFWDFKWVGDVIDWGKGAAADIYEFSQDPAVQAVYAGAAAAYGYVSAEEQRQISERAAWIAARFAAVGVQLTPEQAVALARQPDKVVEEMIAQAERERANRASESARDQTSGGSSAFPPFTPGPAPSPLGGLSPLLLAGGAALLLVVVAKK